MDDGASWSCGENQKGQLGLGHNDSVGAMPKRCTALMQIPLATVSCGQQFMWCISTTGQVYSVGSNFFGKLGIDKDGGSVNLPTHVEALEGKDVVQIACGSSFVWARTLAGELRTVGGNMSGELGLGDVQSIAVP